MHQTLQYFNIFKIPKNQIFQNLKLQNTCQKFNIRNNSKLDMNFVLNPFFEVN